MCENILRSWAKFQKLDYFGKRKLFSEMIAKDTDISCEWRISKILTRLTFKKYKDLHKIQHPEDRFVKKYIDELNLSPSTVSNWYYETKKEHPYQKHFESCENCRFCSFCFGNSDKVEKIHDKYGYGLLSNRMYQILVKIDKFKSLLSRKYSDDDIRIGLRKIVQDQYYSKKQREYDSDELDYFKASKKMNLKPVAVLRWFYLIRNSKELMEMAKANEISPEEVVSRCMRYMRRDVHDKLYDLRGELA